MNKLTATPERRSDWLKQLDGRTIVLRYRALRGTDIPLDNDLSLRTCDGVTPLTAWVPSVVEDESEFSLDAIPHDYAISLLAQAGKSLVALPADQTDARVRIKVSLAEEGDEVPAHPAIPRHGNTTVTVAPSQRPAKPVPLPDALCFPADRIHKGAVEALSMVYQWRGEEGFHVAYRASVTDRSSQSFEMFCGFSRDPGAEVWQFLLARGEATIKAHYALWARLFEQTGGQPGRYARMNINQFCADLGYKPHKNGGFKPERKREAMRLLEVLTSIEIAVRFRTPGRKPKILELSGPLWSRGFRARQRDDYADLFGYARVGNPDLWEPIGFTFSPGPWFDDPEWRKYNQYLGVIGSGLMHLATDNDQAAIRIGGYLGTLARFRRYRTTRIRIETLLRRIGMADLYSRDPQRLQDRIERGFDRLVDVGVIADWGYTNAALDEDEPDMDDPDTLAALADRNLPAWRRRTIEAVWPASLSAETKRLEKAECKARLAEERKQRRKESPK